MWTVPNLLTFARLALIIPICLIIPLGWMGQAIAFVLYGIAAVTDYLDGWWARTYNQGSDFGRMLDPIVDKVMIAALFIVLSVYGGENGQGGVISGIFLACPIIILSREFLVAGLREFLGPKGVVINVTSAAKWKTTTQMIAVGVLIFPGMQVPGLFLLIVATGLTVYTGYGYIRESMKHF